MKSYFSSVQGSVIIGALIIAISILVSNGTIRLKGLSTAQKAASPSPSSVVVSPQASPTPTAKVDVSIGHLPLQGEDSAKVTVIEFADLRCPFCERWFKDVGSNLLNDYIKTGKIKFYFRHWAFLGPASTLAANATECASEQGKFWDMHDYLYKNQPSESDTSMYTVDNLTQVSGTLGINTEQFKSCLSTNKYDKQVSSDYADGQKAGVSGTPTVFIGGKPIVGACPYSVFETAIKNELAGKSWSVSDCQVY